VDFLYADMTQASFWVAVFQIIIVNIILSGDNAVVIALACMHLPPKQRLWGMVLGAAAAVLLRILFTLVVAQAMAYSFLKLVGGLLLLWIAVKLVAEDAGGDDDKVKKGETLWQAVWIVTVADIVMSLDNVIAIAASAETAAMAVDSGNALAVKTTLIVFGLATSVPLIIAGSALLMALLQRFPILVWAGGGLLGWVAGDIMAKDDALLNLLSPATVERLHLGAAAAGALFVVGVGYLLVRSRRAAGENV
jgi:YjbE family integral membrane protein